MTQPDAGLPQVDLITALGVIEYFDVPALSAVLGNFDTRYFLIDFPDTEGRKRNRLTWYLRQVYLRLNRCPGVYLYSQDEFAAWPRTTGSRRCDRPPLHVRLRHEPTAAMSRRIACLTLDVEADFEDPLGVSACSRTRRCSIGTSGSSTERAQGHGLSRHVAARQVRRRISVARRADPRGVRDSLARA